MDILKPQNRTKITQKLATKTANLWTPQVATKLFHLCFNKAKLYWFTQEFDSVKLRLKHVFVAKKNILWKPWFVKRKENKYNW